ncbi:hypothetical protein [Ensifer sp. YR511]|uniref:hypothetical protein n=1 Tax=Ensifer sp. YR511 TaxID=1855294 RepID=UPI00088CB1F1|nr:hypothetical protein [Ensifer sp. YR511]SDN38039.1 hypothetical protein SAMN05216328_1253 [Ensifer sp. YR511]SDN48290.1 hypothetical protein SAMN05216328_12791 [Ensifer sp. YR511]SDN66400.1 hypothetical protein SAMN05216328_13258 [Ensifer sp. YR511]SDN95022.1 hypothetical protein SAMN05216328_1443 [Ensifer sp. YR511]
MTAANLGHIPRTSSIRSDTDIVLKSMKLKDGTNREALSRFGDDVWDLDPAIFQDMARHAFRTLDFSTITCPREKLTAKEYIYAWLNERLPDAARRLRPMSARAALGTLRQLMTFVREREGRFDAALIDQDLLNAYLVFQKNRSVSPYRIAECLRPALQLHRLARFLTHGGLSLVPWNGAPPYRVAGCSGHTYENVTPRIPDAVIAELLRWSLRYVELFSIDIFAAREELDELEAGYSARPRGAPAGSVVARVTSYIDIRRRAGRGIPVWNDPADIAGLRDALIRGKWLKGEVLNIRLISLQSCVRPSNLIQNKAAFALLLEAVQELGVEHGGMDTPITIDPTSGRPWRSRFDDFSLAHEERQLQTAAYILCAYLTGMRDSEVQAMQSGSLQRKRSADGMIERLTIRSTVYKGREERGSVEEWVTIAPVVRAIEVAERLVARHRPQRRQGCIWVALHRKVARDGGVPHVVQRINGFRQNLDRRFGTADEPAIPLVDGRCWIFNTRQFRRTVAWYIANRPFGVVAGKIQYKHASVAIFDGYAGSSTSGFRQEVEQEHYLGQLDDIVEHYEAARRGERLTGPGASRVIHEIERVTKEIGSLPGVIADGKRMKAMLAHLARTLHVGYLNDCFFEPATALCLTRSGTSTSQPILSNCAPDRCPNSCIARRHLPAWQAAIAHAEAMLQERRLSNLQRSAIRQDRDRMRKLIAPLREEPP